MNGLTVWVLLFTVCCCSALIGPSSLLTVVSEEFSNFVEVSEEDLFGDDASQQLPLAPDASCNDTVFDKCNANFAKDLNITAPVRSAKDFVKILMKIMEKEGKNGFKKICKAFNNHKKCLGKSYDACVNVDYFKKRGVKPTDAYVYVTLLFEFGYECSPGPQKIILDNWDCIASIEVKYRRHSKKCVKDFVKSVKKRPANVCPLAQKMVSCIDFPFGRACNQSVVTVMCNTIKAGLRVSLPKCNISCPKGVDELDEVNVETSDDNPTMELFPEDVSVRLDQDVDDESSNSINFVIPNPLSKNLLAQFAQQEVQSCDDDKFHKALDHYAQLFGFKKLPLHVNEFGKALSDYLQRQGKIGFKKICHAGQEFYRRLGKDQYTVCMTQENFESLGFAKTDAFVYLDIAAQMFYECGDGYDVFFANYDCIVNTGKEKAEELKKCTDEFTSNMTKDPSKVCDYAQSLLCCMEGPYQEACGADVAHATCMVGKASINHALPTCKSVSCDSGDEERIAVHRIPLKKIHKKPYKPGDNSVRGGIGGGGSKFATLFENTEEF